MRALASAVCLAFVLASACDNPTRTGGEVSGLLHRVSGDSQVTLPLGELPRPLVVSAVDEAGQPRAGVLITWTSVNGAQFVTDTSRTDASGRASNVWMLGNAEGAYRATAHADGHAPVEFSASTSDRVRVRAIPDTVRFASLGDTATVLLHVTSSDGLDTIIKPRSWSWYNTPLIAHISVHGLVQSAGNGTTTMTAFYGRRPVPFTVIVRQVSVGLRIAAQGGTLPVGDTTVMGPRDTTSFIVAAVDARGHLVADSAALSGVAWESSDTTVVAIDSTGTARSRSDGLATLRARKDSIEAVTPLRVWSLLATSLMVDGHRGCALRADSTMACWGWRNWVAGSAPSTFSVVPEPRTAWGRFISFASLGSSVCGVRPGGQAVCWGDNHWGQLGIGALEGKYGEPQSVAGGLTFASVSAGSTRNCGLSPDGEAWCWGTSLLGVLGDSLWGPIACHTWSRCAPEPVRVAGGLRFTTLTMGRAHSCALTADGRAWCWGINDHGQLGSPRNGCETRPGGNPVTNGAHCRAVPTEVSGDLRFQSISAGDIYTCGVTTDGDVYCWGENHGGQLGVPSVPADFAPHATPLRVSTAVPFRSVSAGSQHTCAIDADGAAWCWGLQLGGSLGNGEPGSATCINGKCERAPVRVAGGLSFSSIRIGGANSCGMTTTGLVYCWGAGLYGNTGSGVTANQLVPVRVRFQ